MLNKSILFQAAIFDLDGTLLDSTYVWEWVDQEFLSRRGLTVPSDYIDAVCSKCFQEAADYTIKRFGLKEKSENIINEWHELALYQYSEKVKLKPFAKEYIKELKKNGIKIATATSLSKILAEIVLKQNEIWDLFDEFCFSSDVGKGKEFPDLYLHTAKKLELEPVECVLFEDIFSGIKCAKSIGMQVYGIADPYSLKQKQKIIAIADMGICKTLKMHHCQTQTIAQENRSLYNGLKKR